MPDGAVGRVYNCTDNKLQLPDLPPKSQVRLNRSIWPLEKRGSYWIVSVSSNRGGQVDTLTCWAPDRSYIGQVLLTTVDCPVSGKEPGYPLRNGLALGDSKPHPGQASVSNRRASKTDLLKDPLLRCNDTALAVTEFLVSYWRKGVPDVQGPWLFTPGFRVCGYDTTTYDQRTKACMQQMRVLFAALAPGDLLFIDNVKVLNRRSELFYMAPLVLRIE